MMLKMSFIEKTLDWNLYIYIYLLHQTTENSFKDLIL